MRNHGDLYGRYRLEIEGESLARTLRVAVVVFFVIQTVFIGVDWLIFPESFWKFLPARLALNIVFAGIYLLTSRSHPLGSTFAVCWVGGAMLLMVVAGTGAGSSGYYVGLVLLFMGLGTMVPVSALHAATILGALYAAYCLVGLQVGESIEWNLFGMHLFFLAAAGFAGVVSCGILDRMRFAEFCQRIAIEEARDELRVLDRAKSRFTANIHHELRTPLTLMMAPLDALRAGDLGPVPEAIDRTLRTMQANGLRLLKLINNLLDLAKVESHQLEVKRVPLEIPRLVGEVAEGARGLAERKGLVLETRVAPGVPVVNVDPDALEKVLVNLLGNALKFTEEGRITVELEPVAAGEYFASTAAAEESEAQADARPGEHSAAAPREPAAAGGAPGPERTEGAAPPGGVHLIVRDTGMGIPAEQLGKVFDRFAQVDGSSTRRHEGTGIGLSLVKELVELHGGHIWAESGGAGQGATMHVLLPVGESDRQAEEEVLLGEGGTQAFTAAASFRGLAAEVGVDLDAARYTELERTVTRHEGVMPGATVEDLEGLPEHPHDTPEVVVVEDNAEMRRLLAMLIGREFRVRPARNGAEALVLVRANPPELVVTDVMMPEMSGTELCRAIKADEETRGVPVMLVTSKAEREMKIEGLELGAEDYVTKPFHPRELMARVRALVRLRVLQGQLESRSETLARRNVELATALADLKEAEVQLVQAERLAAVGELSAGVAHEVNNPLNFARNALAALRSTVEEVRAFAAQLEAMDLADPAAVAAMLREKETLGLEQSAGELDELIAIVTEGLDRTSRLVAELRDFASPRRGGDGVVDVRAGLEGTLRLLGHRFREARAALQADIPAGLPAVPGDAGALNQVFLNLLKNAAEALEASGGGELHVSARAEGPVLVVRIRDGGPGMDFATQARLFEPFFTTKAAGRGTGLGLSICRRIVGEHGGRIAVDSAPGRGTSFAVHLPLDAEAPLDPPTIPDAADAARLHATPEESDLGA